jgi:hypothetical protein
VAQALADFDQPRVFDSSLLESEGLAARTGAELKSCKPAQWTFRDLLCCRRYPRILGSGGQLRKQQCGCGRALLHSFIVLIGCSADYLMLLIPAAEQLSLYCA